MTFAVVHRETAAMGPPMRIGNQRGFTYIWMLAAIAIASLGLAVIGSSWADQAKRERERELLRIGSLYAQAIADYWAASPGVPRQFPQRLEDLLDDSRMVGTARYLRRPYADPIDPSRPWGVVLDPNGRVQGIYSQAAGEPLRQESLDLGGQTLPAARKYSDWKFVAKVKS